MNYTVKKHDLGYYFIYPLPSEQELKDYYEKKYYQDLTAAAYQQSYNEEELAVLKIDAELETIYILKIQKNQKNFDIVCGEGFLEKHERIRMKKSTEQIIHPTVSKFKPDLEDKVIYGELNQVLDKLIQNNKTFDFINLANILEHLVAPIDLLKKCHKLLSHEGVLRVKVPNDFSPFKNI